MLQTKNSIEIIKQINLATGVLSRLRKSSNTHDLDFEGRYLKPLLVIADWLQELPASSTHHSESGGAVRLAIHAGFASVRMSESFIFTPSDKSEFRYALEKQYSYACFLATIFSTISYTLTNTQVSNDAGEIWNKRIALKDFTKNYNVQWSDNSNLDARKNLFQIAKIFPDELLINLDDCVVNDLMNSLSIPSGKASNESAMQKAVNAAIKKVIDIELELIHKSFSNSKIHNISAEEILIEKIPQSQLATTTNNEADIMSAPIIANEITAETMKNHTINLSIINIDKGVAEILRLLKEDLASGKRDVNKLKMVNSGLILPSSFFSNYGLGLARIESELRKKSLVVNKEGQIYTLKKELGAWLIEGVDKKLFDMFEEEVNG